MKSHAALISLIVVGLVAADGLAETPLQVTLFGARQPAVSPLGNQFCASTSEGIVLFDLNGVPLDTLDWGDQPSWSPDGSRVAYRRGGILTIEIAPGTIDILCSCNANNGLAWSPLGDEIVFQDPDDGLTFAQYPSGTMSGIFCDDPTGSSCDGEWPSWSPDGQWIAFEDGREILKVSRAGGEADTVVAGLGDVSWPAWSPDGDWIAFSMDDGSIDQNTHIWVADARGFGFGLIQLTDGSAFDKDATWSPDSQTIYFSSNRGGGQDIWKVDFDPSVQIKQTTWGRVKAERR